MKKNLAHLMLTSGDEIICEILNEDNAVLTVRHAYKIFTVETEAMRYHMLRPWLSYQIENSKIQLAVGHIVGRCKPHKQVIKHYNNSINEYTEKAIEENNNEMKELINRIANMADEKLDESVEYMDSDQNIIKFNPNKDKWH